MPEPIRVLVVDDQMLIREGLRTLLELHAAFSVVAEAADGHEALMAYATHSPDVVLMDINMPNMDGVEATRLLCQEYADARILILTTFDNDEYVFEGIRAGALGYMLKDVSSQELANAVQVVAAGGSMMGAAVARKVLTQFANSGPQASPPQESLVEPLSERETEILHLMAQGLNNGEISAQLHLAGGTVKNYVSNILQKLTARDRTQAVIRAQQLGLL
ncbi:response regulator transcription factor [Chloroflexi bacterium TSY]|nr:response regulator transcription factor [Chloroflexi bacterium TSY]